MNKYMEDNASFYPELTELLKEITSDISCFLIKEGTPIIILGNYRWIIEALSLMTKQINLCDSCILLLENGMEQEAYLLVRSQFNNMLWIKYICDDCTDEHTKEYFYQPYAVKIKSNKTLKNMLENFEEDLDERFDKEVMVAKLDEISSKYKRILKKNNMSTYVKPISDLAKQSGDLFGMYATLYNDASKFEHSEMSQIRKYRKKVMDEYTEDEIFTIEMSKSDEKDWLVVLHSSLLCLFYSFDSFSTRIINHEKHLFEDTAVTKAPYRKADFDKILKKIYICLSALEKVETKNS